jgi:hypothetical protein
MIKAGLKEALIDFCRKKLLDSITALEEAIKDTQQQANDYGPPKDRYDAFRSQLLRKRDMLAQQVSKEMNELKTLEMIDVRKKMDTIGFGALVLTPDQNYFISIGMGKIVLDNIDYYAISPLVPLSQQISGKKKGDKIEFRGKQILISEVL